jgi:prepilin peptidase CpaA
MDFSTGKISNYFIVAGLITGFVLQRLFGGNAQIIYSLAGAIIPILVLAVVFVIGGIGAGDIKLFSVIGVFLGVKGVFTCIVVSFIIGAVISLGKILVSRNFYLYFNNLINYVSLTYQSQKIQLYKKEKSNTIHFTLPIFISVLLYLGGIV